MSSPKPKRRIPPTGLPVGVEAGPLGRRLVAHLVDLVVPAVVLGVADAVVTGASSRPVQLGAVTVAALLVLLWALLVWRMFAKRAAGPGMRLMKLQLVGLKDGRPIGWSRFFVRWLLLTVLEATGVGVLVMLVFLVRQQRRQGWHDLAATSVVIKRRSLAPSPSVATGRPAHRPDTEQSAAEAAPVQPAAVRPTSAEAAPVSAPPVPAPEPVASADPVALAEPAAPAQPAVGAPEEPDRVEVVEPPEQETPEPPAAGSTVLLPAEPAEAAEVPPEPVDDRPRHQGWAAVLDDGRRVEVTALVLLGRSPQVRAGEDEAELVQVADEARTVSKTHLALGVDAQGLYVMDRGSTNGSIVTDPAGTSHACAPGELVPVTEDSIVSFGDHWLRIARAPGR